MDCGNQVLIGNYSCPIISSSSEKIICQIETNSGLIPGDDYKFELRVENYGNALQDSWYTFRFIPAIISITPDIGKLILINFIKYFTIIFC